MSKFVVLQTSVRVGYMGYYYLVVPDMAAGMYGRYTAYHIRSHPGIGCCETMTIIGRELSKKEALAACKKHYVKDQTLLSMR